MKTLEFEVDVCFGRDDGGTVCVDVDVTDGEYESLMECCRDEDEIDGYPGLEDLCNRIKEAAKDENESCMMDSNTEEEIDYSSVSFRIHMPDEITDAVEEEEVSWFDYEDYPFAMETVNGTILSMTEEFQRTVLDRILEKCNTTEEALASWMRSRMEEEYGYDDEDDEDEDDENDEDEGESEPEGDFRLLNDEEYEFLAEILGFDEDDERFEPCDSSESQYGWETKELLEKLGFVVDSNIKTYYGVHGRDANGVYFIENITFRE